MLDGIGRALGARGRKCVRLGQTMFGKGLSFMHTAAAGRAQRLLSATYCDWGISRCDVVVGGLVSSCGVIADLFPLPMPPLGDSTAWLVTSWEWLQVL